VFAVLLLLLLGAAAWRSIVLLFALCFLSKVVFVLQILIILLLCLPLHRGRCDR
jgi:hypothetical protein